MQKLFIKIWRLYSVQIALPEACNGSFDEQKIHNNPGICLHSIYFNVADTKLFSLFKIAAGFYISKTFSLTMAPIQKQDLTWYATIVRPGWNQFMRRFRHGKKRVHNQKACRVIFPAVASFKTCWEDLRSTLEWLLRGCRAPEWQIRIPFHRVRINFMLCDELWAKALDCQALLHI